MKKNSPSQSALFNPRVLLIMALFLTGVFVVLVGFGQSGRGNNTHVIRPATNVALAGTRLASFPQPRPPCAPPPAGMVSWWPGDGNANDISGSNYNGTVSGGVTFTLGEVNQAFTFNGTDGEVILPDSPSAPLLDFGPNDSFTIDAWLKPDPSVLGTNRAAVMLTYVCSPELIQIFLILDGRIDFEIRDSNGIDVPAVSPSSILDGNWHHVTGVRDVSSQSLLLYLDGIAVANVVDNTTGTFTRADGQNRIGSIAVACPTNRYFWQGQIDEVEVFRRALSQAEIQSIVNAGSAGKCRSQATPTPTPTSTPTATPTPTPTPTPCSGRCAPTPRPRPTPAPRP